MLYVVLLMTDFVVMFCFQCFKLSVGRQEGIRPVKTEWLVLAWLSVWGEDLAPGNMQICTSPVEVQICVLPG